MLLEKASDYINNHYQGGRRSTIPRVVGQTSIEMIQGKSIALN